MKVKISYTLDLTKEQEAACVAYAQCLGHGFDNPDKRELLKRLFSDTSTRIINQAESYYKELKKEQQGQWKL